MKEQLKLAWETSSYSGRSSNNNYLRLAKELEDLEIKR